MHAGSRNFYTHIYAMSGFNLGGAVNGLADWACSAPLIRSVVNNPVFTSLLITALAAIVAMALYGKQIKKGGNKRGCRALVYVFLLVTAVIFVHHYAVRGMARDVDHTAGVRAVYAGIEASRAVGGGAVPVYPSSADSGGFSYSMLTNYQNGSGYKGTAPPAFRANNVAVEAYGGAPEQTAAASTLEGIRDVVLPLGVRGG